MLCRRCGIYGDRVRPKWWHRIIPGLHRYYCAGCGRKYLSFRECKRPFSNLAERPFR